MRSLGSLGALLSKKSPSSSKDEGDDDVVEAEEESSGKEYHKPSGMDKVYVKKLEKNGFSPEQAMCLVQVVKTLIAQDGVMGEEEEDDEDSPKPKSGVVIALGK